MANTNDDEKTVLAETQYLRLVQQGRWTYAQRTNVTGAMAIIAVTDDQRLLMIDQYRVPVAGRVIELPAGLVGDVAGHVDESIEDAAKRELLEEVGYHAERVTVMTHGVSSAGLTDERVHLVMAHGLRQMAAGGGDETEDIIVHHVPIDQVHSWLGEQQRQGKDVDFKVFAALYCYGKLSSGAN